MFLALYSITPFPAPCAAYGSGCPGKRIWNAKCYACTSQGDVRFLWAKPFREPTLRLPPLYDARGPQPGARPHSVPTDLLSTFVSSQRVYWKNDESSSSEPPFLPFCPFPAVAVRYDQPLASPPFNNFAPNWHEVTCFRLPLTSCQVGRKLTHGNFTLPANLAGS